jgi:hypothetical protein
MPDLAVTKAYDAYGHANDAWTQNVAGYTAATTGTAPGTLVNPGTADPTGTTNVTIPNCISDGYGQFAITTAGTQTTGALRTVYFQNPYPVLRPVLVLVSTTAGVAAGGTITATMSLTNLAISVGTALTTATTYYISYVIL